MKAFAEPVNAPMAASYTVTNASATAGGYASGSIRHGMTRTRNRHAYAMKESPWASLAPAALMPNQP